jgi:ribosomal protein L37AE/L43A
MPEIKSLATRACPICRVAMVHCDFGWSCPQCGSAIIEPAHGEVEPGNEAAEQSVRAAADMLRG